MKIIKLGLLVATLIFSTLASAGGCNLGQVSALDGNATLERRGRSIAVDTDILVCKGDKFITSETSVMQLTLQDGSIITIGKDSEFTVTTFEIYRRKPSLALFELTKGAFRAVTGYMTKRPHRYEVKTVTATIGVRGTDFWGGYGLTEDGLDVVMLSGKGVYVRNNNGETVELNQAGLGTTVISTDAPTTPKIWGEEKVAKAVATITAQ
jgi:hypothetical protein